MDPKAPVRHHAPQPIGPDTHVIRQMLGEDEGPVAVYVNSLVIAGPEPIVVDTGTAVNREQWLEDVFGLVDPEDISYVFLSHDDHDHVGNLVPLLQAAPQAKLITTWFTQARLAGDLEIPLDRMLWVNDGDRFVAGGRTFLAVRPPLYDSPTTRGLYDPVTGIYWAGDAYAAAVPHAVESTDDLDPGFWDEQFTNLNLMGSPWATIADPAAYGREVDRVERLGITTIASAHSPVIAGWANVNEAHDKIRRLAGRSPVPLPGQVDLDAMLTSLDPGLERAG